MDIKEWLGEENTLGTDIWQNKYQFEGETFEEWLDRVSDGNEDIKQLIRDKKFLFGGRILSNRGLEKHGKKVTYSNCYVLETDDNIEAIYKTCSDLARTFSYGGGCGVDISKLRAKGMKVNNASKETTGACSFMDTFSQVTSTIGQNGRRGALMLSLDCTHPELIDFINIKTDLDKVTKANISVRVNDDFMRAVENDEDWVLSFETENDKMEEVVKAKEVFQLLCKNNWNFAEPGILYWSRIEDYNLLSKDWEFKYAGVNPCAEEPLPNGGSCLLGSINLSAYVIERNNKGYFDIPVFKKDVHTIVKAMNDVLDQGLPLHPLQIQRDTVRDYRQIGIGVMGIADMLIKLGVKYDTDEAIEICDTIGKILANESIKASALLAKEEGYYPKYKSCILDSEFLKENVDEETFDLVVKYGLRNSQLLTIAPTGSISTMIGVSGGIEPIFNLSYTIKTESLHKEGDVYYKVFTPIAKEYMDKHGITEEEDLPNFFVTAQTLNPHMRVKMQGAWQKHIDASISSTINLPNEATVEEVEQLYMEAWKEGLKGLTIYRDGCARTGILTNKDTKEDEESHELKRGEWEAKPQGCIEIPRKIYSGCGKELLHITIDPKEKRIIDFYITSSSTGGCKLNIQALAISMSAILRLGGSIENIKCAFRGIGKCPSYVLAKEKGKKVSKGVSCPTAILNVLMQVDKDLKEEKLEELQLLGYYDKKIVENIEEDIKDLKEELIERVKELEEQEHREQIFTERELEYIREYGEIQFAQTFSKCPKCGEKMEHVGGCISCMNCAFTKCE